MTETLEVVGGRPLRGTIKVPGDKSIAHRALMLAGLADGISVVRGMPDGDDVGRTAGAMAALGAEVRGERIVGGRQRISEPSRVLDCGNSGTAIRLLSGLVSSIDGLSILAGDESVNARPMDRVVKPLREMGAKIEGRSGAKFPPLVVRGGKLRGIDYALPVPSAQVKSAVLLAALSAEGATTVREAVPTRAHTEELLALAGASVRVESGTGEGKVVLVEPSELSPFELDVPGDPSAAAFWAVAATIVPGSELTIEGIYLGPARDGFLHVLERMGAQIEVSQRGAVYDLHVRSAPLRATNIGGDEVVSLIDEVPVLAVAAALAEGTSRFEDMGELRVKESDRLATVATELARLGARLEVVDDGLAISGGSLRGSSVDSHGDHRLAMSLAVAGLVADGLTRVEGWDAARTSYPGFEATLQACAS